MSGHSPTCVMSGPSSIQEPPGVCTISSELESTSTYYSDQSSQDQSSAGSIANQSRCCPGILPAITRSHDATDFECPRSQNPPNPSSSKSSKSNKSSGWKTSKFFSKTMSSGEILRSLKKLSLTSSGSTSDPCGEEHGKPRKSKSGQLKKRSSCGNDDTMVVDDTKLRSPRSPGSFRPLSKAMSISEPGSTSSKNSSLGIVCKKEDLKAILCTASKKFPLASPSKRRKGQAPLRQTKSASFEPPDERQTRREPVQRAGSEESRTKRSNASFDNNEVQSNENESDPAEIGPISSSLVVDSLNAQNLNMNTDYMIVEHSSMLGSMENSLSTVKWDECEVVDAVIIGDAIESFLKGSMMGQEKKVSFRRHSEKRSKSDG